MREENFRKNLCQIVSQWLWRYSCILRLLVTKHSFHLVAMTEKLFLNLTVNHTLAMKRHDILAPVVCDSS